MKILHISYDSLGNLWVNGGGAKRTDELRSRMIERGHVFDWQYASPDEQKKGKWWSRLAFMRRMWVNRNDPALDEYDVISYEFSPFCPIWIPRRLRDRVVLSIYHLHDLKSLVRKAGPFALGCWWLQWRVLHKYPRKIALSTTMGHLLNCPAIPPGVDGDLFEIEPEYTAADQSHFFLYLGRLDVEMKGIDLLLDAWKGVDSPLWICGRGDVDEIEGMSKARNLTDRVVVMGPVPEDQKRDMLRRCRAVVMPSRYEGWGIVAVEAQACAKLVIGSEAVRDATYRISDQTFNTPEEIQRQACIFAEDETRARELGLASREWARKFSWDSMTDQMVEAFGGQPGSDMRRP